MFFQQLSVVTLLSIICNNIHRVSSAAPVWSNCPVDIVVNATTGSNNATVIWTEPTVSDADEPDTNVFVRNFYGTTNINEIEDPNVFLIGFTEVRYLAEDSEGTSSECVFTVTVFDPSPVPILAADYPVVDSLSMPISNLSYVRCYTATNTSGNGTVCTFYLTIEDDEASIFQNCPSDISAETDFDENTSEQTWTNPIAIDNNSVPIIVQSHTSPFKFSIGITNVTYQAIDDSGNTSLCYFLVNITDSEAPVYDICPEDQHLTIGKDMDHAIGGWVEPVYTDNSGIVNVTRSHLPFTAFYRNTEVIYTATDLSGNINSTCRFGIYISGTEDVNWTLISLIFFGGLMIGAVLAVGFYVGYRKRQKRSVRSC